MYPSASEILTAFTKNPDEGGNYYSNDTINR